MAAALIGQLVSERRKMHQSRNPARRMIRRATNCRSLEQLERRMLLSAALGSQPVGTLSGKIIFMSGGHGYTAANTTDGHW